MSILLTIFRGITAIAIPLAAIILTVLTALQLRGAAGIPADEGETCLRCSKNAPGGEAQFQFTEPIGNARERAAKQQFSAAANPILGSETHYICDKCAQRYFRGQMLQHVLLALPYPIYLFAFISLLASDSFLTNFLVETLLAVLAIAGLVAAFDLYRAVRQGETRLDEARDRVAIGERKNRLGKNLSYYTRRGMGQLYK